MLFVLRIGIILQGEVQFSLSSNSKSKAVVCEEIMYKSITSQRCECI